MAGSHLGAGDFTGEQNRWMEAHEALSRLAKERAAADAEEGRWLLTALRTRAHVHLGFGSFGEYVERLFGYRPRSTQEKLRVAEALEGLPVIAQALAEGGVSWSAAREITRVAVPETEREWLEVAGGKTVHELEGLVAGRRPGEGPASPAGASASRHVLRFDVAPETLVLWREAMRKLRGTSDAALDDDAALLLMARNVLAGPTDEGRSSYQIALSVCPACSSGAQHAHGDPVPVGVEVVAMAQCDGQHLGLMDTRPADEGAHVGASPDVRDDASRSTQTIPPRVRRNVLARDRRRCVVPGCRNARYLDLHHMELRSEGGGNEPDNLVTLCGAHHRAVHRGELHVSGSVSAGVRFRHAEGSRYGAISSVRAADVQAKAFAALRGLGFREGEVRRALTHSGTEHGELTVEQVVRDALARLMARGQSE